MPRWISVVVGSVLVVLGILSPALAQTAPLVGGGLTALPKVTLGPNQLKNAGFETVNGSVPTSWSTGTGLGLDQLVKHSGTFSYRATGKFTTISQPIPLKKGIYKLSGWVRTQGVGSGTTKGVRLQFDLRPALNEWKTTDVISGTNDWALHELGNLVVTQDTTVTIRLENYNNTAGTAWFDDIKLEEQQGSGVEVFLLHPNFRGMLFDDQPQAMRFDVTVTPPGGDFGRYRVSGTLEDEATGQVVASQIYAPTASFVAELEGGAMQMGRPYLATFSLVDPSTGTTVATYPAYRVSRAPAAARAAMSVAFDAKNRVLVRGVPRFVLGVYDSRSSYSAQDPFWESQLWSPTGERRMDGLKINFYLNYWYGEAPAAAMKALMTNLQKHGVMYLQTGNCFDTFAAGTNFLVNSAGADAYVRDIGAHPGLAGYYTIDECLSSLIPGAFAQYDRLRRLDPDSVTFSTNFGTPELTLWRDSADILSTDPYPLYGAQPAGGYNHGEVGEWTALTRDAVKDARPIMTVLQFFKFTAQGRFPTLAEMRNHAWMAIVEGARGLWWWSLGDNALTAVCSNTWCAERTGYMNNLKAVVNEIADLEPVLLADDAPGALAGNSNPSAIRTRVKLLDGHGYVFAYNTTNAQVSATFRWNTAPGTVTVNAERRTVGPSGTSFTDSFGPYQAHVYVLGTGGNPGSGASPGGGENSGGTGPGAPSVSFLNPASDATVSSTTTVTLAGSAGSGSGYLYQVAVDGATVYTGSNPSFSWNTTTVANGTRQLVATVTDSGSKKGTATRTVKVANAAPPTPPPAPTPPPPAGLTVSITDPLGGRTLSGTNWTVVWVTGAKGGSNVYTLTAGGRTVATFTTTSTGPVSIPWDTATVANGSQVLTASVRHSAGHTGSAKVTVTLKNVATPALTASFTTPAASATVKGTVTVGLTSSGGTGTRTYRLALDGALVATSASYAWDTTRAANGSHTLAVTVTDGAGRTATASRTVTVSNGLAVFITQPLGVATVRGTAWVVLWVENASGKSNTFTLKVDGATVGTYTTAEQGPVTIPWTTTSKANGNHTVTASVRDATGKTGSTSITVAVRN